MRIRIPKYFRISDAVVIRKLLFSRFVLVRLTMSFSFRKVLALSIVSEERHHSVGESRHFCTNRSHDLMRSEKNLRHLSRV
eukprot:IDg22671t1